MKSVLGSMFIIFTICIHGNTIDRNQLIGEWLFNEVIENGNQRIFRDTSGNGNDGVGFAYQVDGVSGTAIEFDGNQEVIVDNFKNIGNYEHAFTLEVWAKVKHGSNTMIRKEKSFFLEFGEGISNNLGFTPQFGYNVTIPPLHTGQSLHVTDGTFKLPADEWYFLAMTFDGSFLRCYVDGKLITERKHEGKTFFNLNEPLRFGRWTSEKFVGAMDEVRIWSKALSGEQIKSDFEELAPTLQTNLVGEWLFEGNTNDSSGNGNHAVNNGGTFVPGINGLAIEHNGTHSVVNQFSPNFSFNHRFTLALAVKPAGPSQTMVRKGDTPDFLMELGEGTSEQAGFTPQFAYSTENTDFNKSLIAGEPLPNNRWSYLTMTYDGTSLTGYINGNEVSRSEVIGLSLNDPSKPLYFGTWQNEIFNGQLDDIRIWSRALHPFEIEELFQSFGTPDPIVANPDQTIHVNYSNLSSGNIRDSHGNLLNGVFDVFIDGVVDLPSSFFLHEVSISNGRITSIQDYSGLNIAGMEIITDKQVSYNNGQINIEGGIKLPVVPLPSGAFVFAIRDNQFFIEQGSINIPKLTIPKLFGMEGDLTIGQDLFDLNGFFGFRGLGGDPTKVGWIGGGATIKNNLLDRIALKGESLNIKLGDTGALLDAIDAEVSKITNPKDLTLNGAVTIIGGPKIAGLSAILINVDGSITPGHGAFSLHGESYLFTIMQMSEQSLAARIPDNLQLYSKVFYAPYITGIANLRFARGGNPVFYGSIEGSLELNFKVLGKRINVKAGGIEMAVSDNYVEGTVSSSVDLIFVKKRVYATMRLTFGDSTPRISAGVSNHYEYWETSHNPIYIIDDVTGDLIPVDPSLQNETRGRVNVSSTEKPKLYASFLNNWQVVDKVYLTNTAVYTNNSVRIASDLTTTLSVPQNVGEAVVRINFENTGVENVMATVISPSGVVNNQVVFEPFSQEAFLLLDNPEPGEYSIVVANQESLGNAAVELIKIDQPPVIDSLSVAETSNPDEFRLDWAGFDLESNATVRFALSDDRDGADGFYFLDTHEEAGNNSLLIHSQNELDQIASGYYYVMMEINDGVNSPVYQFSNNRIKHINPNDPSPVKGLVVGGNDSSFTLRWERPEDPRVTGYTVYYTEYDDLGVFDYHKAVVDPETTEITVSDVKNGVPLLVSVVSIDDFANRSIVEEIVRVIPHKKDGTSPPAVVNSIPNDAEANSLFIYSPQFANSERYFVADHVLETVLTNAPQGMEVTANGDIVWIPTDNQIGDYPIEIEHRFHFSASNQTHTRIQNGTVSVEVKGELVGEETETEILSQADVSAHENTPYTYQVEVSSSSGTSPAALSTIPAKFNGLIQPQQIPNKPVFELLEGPEGMTIDENGLVQWDVPDFDNAYYPVRIAVIFPNGEVEEQDFILDVVTTENTLSQSGIADPIWMQFK